MASDEKTVQEDGGLLKAVIQFTAWMFYLLLEGIAFSGMIGFTFFDVHWDRSAACALVALYAAYKRKNIGG